MACEDLKLKADTRYDEFIKTVKEKDKLPIDALDTKEELDIVADMVKKNQDYINSQTI